MEIEYFYRRGLEGNVEAFKRIVADNPDLEFFQPNPKSSPWHVQVYINGNLISFWPHVLKGCLDGHKAVVGAQAIRTLIEKARLLPEYAEPELFDDD